MGHGVSKENRPDGGRDRRSDLSACGQGGEGTRLRIFRRAIRSGSLGWDFQQPGHPDQVRQRGGLPLRHDASATVKSQPQRGCSRMAAAISRLSCATAWL